jgi:hypothetical protein
MRQLPVFQGYTVDFRLKEFRKTVYGKQLEFIQFSSPEGQKLLTAFLETPEGKFETNLQT